MTRNSAAIAAAIEAVQRDNPNASLLEMFCDAAGTAFVVAAKGVNTDHVPAEPFKVVIGVQSWIAELDRLGRTPEANRAALAGKPLTRVN